MARARRWPMTPWLLRAMNLAFGAPTTIIASVTAASVNCPALPSPFGRQILPEFGGILWAQVSFKEQVRRLRGLKRMFGHCVNSFFDFNSVHKINGSNSSVLFLFLNRRIL
jgi:hypothetical protein